MPDLRLLPARLLGRHWLRALALSLGAALLGGALAYWAVAAYVIRRADSKVHDLLMSHRGLHHYIQKDMHPAFYAARDRQEVSRDYYDPVIFSSSYIVRVMHGYYNGERLKDGLPPVYYKMAARNPRNPVNLADETEARLIRLFNEDRGLESHREVVQRGGQTYLLHAIPFLQNTPACLRCHGRREDAPQGLQARYPGEGGFNERVGDIRAVEIIRAPLQQELFGAAVTSASLMAGLLTLATLLGFNGALRRKVRVRTLDLVAEVRERRAAEEELAASRQRLSDAAGMARLGHWRLEAARGLYTFTDEFYRMLRTDARAMGGYTLSAEAFAERFVHPEDRFRAAEEIRRALESGDPGFQGEAEYRVLFADGTPGHLLVRCHVELDPGGAAVAAFGVSQDITARKRAEEEAREAKARLLQAQKMESLGCLAGGVAHDMNNVLGAILGLSTALQTRVGQDPLLERSLDTITQACQRGKGMVRGLLDFARKGLEESRPLDVNALVAAEVALLERTTLQRIRLVQELAPGLPPVSGDRSALGSALMNVCLNAVDAMPEGGVLTLRTGAGDGVWIEVEDTGTGMSREVLDKALDPFFTTKPEGKGTGLGLAMAYGTLKAHRGRLEIDSEPGRGTRVRLRLPAGTALPAPAAAVGPVAPLARSLRVLVVDDDELVRNSLEMMLQTLGAEAVLVSRGEEALRRLGEGLSPDLVILDMNMPGLGGKGTLPRIRERAPDLPVILATGRADRGAEGLLSSFDGVRILAKPFGLAELQEELGRLG